MDTKLQAIENKINEGKLLLLHDIDYIVESHKKGVIENPYIFQNAVTEYILSNSSTTPQMNVPIKYFSDNYLNDPLNNMRNIWRTRHVLWTWKSQELFPQTTISLDVLARRWKEIRKLLDEYHSTSSPQTLVKKERLRNTAKYMCVNSFFQTVMSEIRLTFGIEQSTIDTVKEYEDIETLLFKSIDNDPDRYLERKKVWFKTYYVEPLYRLFGDEADEINTGQIWKDLLRSLQETDVNRFLEPQNVITHIASWFYEDNGLWNWTEHFRLIIAFLCLDIEFHDLTDDRWDLIWEIARNENSLPSALIYFDESTVLASVLLTLVYVAETTNSKASLERSIDSSLKSHTEPEGVDAIKTWLDFAYRLRESLDLKTKNIPKFILGLNSRSGDDFPNSPELYLRISNYHNKDHIDDLWSYVQILRDLLPISSDTRKSRLSAWPDFERDMNFYSIYKKYSANPQGRKVYEPAMREYDKTFGHHEFTHKDGFVSDTAKDHAKGIVKRVKRYIELK